MSPPYLPIHGIYLPFLTKTFMYHLEIIQKNILFCASVLAHEEVVVNSWSF